MKDMQQEKVSMTIHGLPGLFVENPVRILLWSIRGLNAEQNPVPHGLLPFIYRKEKRVDVAQRRGL